MSSFGESRPISSGDTYEICIDIMVDTQRTIDKINLMIQQFEDQTTNITDPGCLNSVNDLKKHHSNLLSLKVFISEHLQERTENSN